MVTRGERGGRPSRPTPAAPPLPCAALQAEVMGTRAAQQALAPGRVLLLCAPGSGVTELGVICADAPEGGSSGGGSSGLGGGRGLDAFFAATTARRGGAAGGGAAAAADDDSSSSGGGRKYVVLYLHRPSPLDPAAPAPTAAGLGPSPAAAATAAAPAAPAAEPPAAAAGGGGLPGEPMLRLKKKVRSCCLASLGLAATCTGACT